MNSAYWAIAGGIHSNIATSYPKHFDQSHGCMHIKEGCISVCVHVCVCVCVNYGSYRMCQIIRLDKHILVQSSIALQK